MGQVDLDPERLVCNDETWGGLEPGAPPQLGSARAAPSGKRSLRHRRTTIFAAGLRLTAIAARIVLDDLVNRHAFKTNVARVFVPKLPLPPFSASQSEVLAGSARRRRRHGQSAQRHKGPRVLELIEATGASLRYPALQP